MKEQEPVANYCKECLTYNGHQDACSHYTTPPQRTWVGLTADELNMIGDSMRTWNSHSLMDVYVAIEAKLKEKNT